MRKIDIRHTVRNALSVTITVLAVALMPYGASAADRKVGGADSSKNQSDTKTDFHLSLGGHLPITITTNSLDGTAGTVTGSGTTDVSIDWFNLNVPRGGVVKWAWTGTQKEANITRQVGFFTPRASPTDVPTLGWDINAAHEVFLLNDYTGSAIAFDHLLFQFPTGFTEASLLALVDGAPVGVPGMLTSGVVPAGGSLKVADFPSLSPGNFLTASYDSVFVDLTFSEDTARGALGHEAQVPEPATLALLGSGAASLLAVRFLRAKR